MVGGRAAFLGHGVSLERVFRQPVEKVWNALIVPARFADWMGIEWLGDEPSMAEGSAFEFRFKNTSMESRGRVLRCAPHVLEFTWFDHVSPGAAVRWELAPEGTGCRLTLTETFGRPEDAARQAAGWNQKLDGLAGALGEGGAVAAGMEGWRRLRDGFAAVFPAEARRDARVVTADGVTCLRFERVLRHGCVAVWEALVSPAALARWMQADAVVDPFVGGRFHLAFHAFAHRMEGRILAWERPRSLAFTWPEEEAGGESPVRFELTPAAVGCVLVLVHELRAGGDLADFASGWHWHLDALEGALLGEAREFDKVRWAALRQVYAATLG
jgi:uncharacterized protein YndB with AHSA1/START domain